MKTSVMGLSFDNVTMEQALEAARALLEGDHAACVVTPNAEIAYEAIKNEQMRELLNEADLMLPDGAGVILAGKLLKTPLRQKVAGVDFADGLLGVMEQEGKRLYLLGSKPGVGELAAEKMRLNHPQLQICGIADGYFQDEAPVIEKINEAKPDVLFVCLGSPKQEQFMQRHKDDFPTVRLMAGLGGSLDSFAGTVKRAPKWMIKCNLEWFYRLLREPKRLGRMMRLPKYLGAVTAERVRGKKKWEN